MRQKLKFSAMVVVSSVLASGLAWGELTDPTRPAGSIAQGSSGSGGATDDAGAQAVFIRSGGKSTALVNGQLVSVGDKLGDKAVIKITETEIVVRGENGLETMKLISDVTKMPLQRSAAKPLTANAKRKAQ